MDLPHNIEVYDFQFYDHVDYKHVGMVHLAIVFLAMLVVKASKFLYIIHKKILHFILCPHNDE